MPNQQINRYSNTSKLIQSAIDDMNFCIRTTEANESTNEQLNKELQDLRLMVDKMREIRTYLKPICDDITTYLSKRKEEALQSVNRAISVASSIVPDAMPGVQFKVDGDSAYIVTATEQLVQLCEGDGFQDILSAFLRAVTLSANQKALQLLILDEAFAHVSVEYSAILSQFLPIILQNTQVISVEQKSEVFENLPSYTQYNFRKQNEFTQVTKEEIVRE